MYQRKLKSFVLPLIYSGIIISFFFSIFLLQKTLRKPKINKDIADYDYVIKELFDQEIPVMASEKK
jgi:low affinity Fe/Cu permease